MKFMYRKATLEDLDVLTEIRIEVLLAANKLPEYTDMKEVKKQSYEYYLKALSEGSHIAYLVYDNDKIAGTGGVSFYQVLPTYHNPSGRKAYIMNMYTKQEYRSGR